MELIRPNPRSNTLLRRMIIMGLALTLACADTLDEHASSEHAPEVSSSQSLLISANTAKKTTGKLTKDSQQVAFEISQNGDKSYEIVLRDRAGAVLLRATSSPKRESLTLGPSEDLQLEGPPGTLFSAEAESWKQVSTKGDITRAYQLLAQPDFSLVSELGPALASRKDLVLREVPALSALDPTHLVVGDLYTIEKSHDAAACAACHTACAVTTAGCVIASWGFGAIFCGIAGAVCHIGCAASVCQ